MGEVFGVVWERPGTEEVEAIPPPFEKDEAES